MVRTKCGPSECGLADRTEVRKWTVASVGDGVLRAAARRAGSVKRAGRAGSDTCPPFDLAYVRTGPKTDHPTVVIPGGPGLASILPYRDLRKQASADALDLIMIEHRGVGLSRTDREGKDLPRSAMWIEDVVDDIAAVLDQEGVERAFIAGSSYGSYLASSFGVKYPQRVAGMLLDSALQSTADISIERAALRALFWDADTRVAADVRTLVERGEDQRTLADALRAGYELGGMPTVRRVVSRRVRRGQGSNPAWDLLVSYSARDASIVGIPGYYEFGRVGAIGFRELNYAPVPDGRPLDAGLTYSLLAPDFPHFEGEPFDLPAATPGFDWPLVILMGDRDLRTPGAIALRTAELAPHSVLVPLTNGHSALDTHMLAFEKAVKLLVTGQEHRLAELAFALDGLPRRGAGAGFAKLVEHAAHL